MPHIEVSKSILTSQCSPSTSQKRFQRLDVNRQVFDLEGHIRKRQRGKEITTSKRERYSRSIRSGCE